MTTLDQLVGITAQHNEIVKRVGNGSLDPVAVRRGLQDIIEGKFASPSTASGHPLGWYVTPTEQVAAMARLIHDHPEWGFNTAEIPVIPDDFEQATPTEVLLLVIELPDEGDIGGVQRTFDVAWSLVKTPPDHKANWRWPDLNSDAQHLRLVDGKTPKPGLRWVGFDAFANWDPQNGRRVDTLWANEDPATLAASEALWAAVLFPNWPAAMDGKKVPHTDLAGYQARIGEVNDDTTWSHCPYLGRWVGERQVRLGAYWAGYVGRGYGPPRVRELEAAA